ncbi:large conductance mechanosensitive channel protein MscL [Endozoicomonas sp.]|uniref:large conductance mechanosensitive channel protein MscL n=1 Tax=Endozoicomonas sp. TaxID=1892382 RepID=UPI003AF55810
MKKIIAEYKKFALKGNVLDMAIGIVVGGAFATITSSLVSNVIAPVFGLLTSGVDLADLFLVLKEGSEGSPYITLEDANKDGAVTLSYGLLLNSVISFLIVSWIAFLMVKGINHLRQDEEKTEEVKEEPKNRLCPHCFSPVHKEATRCAFCTSSLTRDIA